MRLLASVVCRGSIVFLVVVGLATITPVLAAPADGAGESGTEPAIQHSYPETLQTGEPAVFPPAPPEGIVGIAVPALVTEPAATYVSVSDPEVAERIVATEIAVPSVGSGVELPGIADGAPAVEANGGLTIEPPTPGAPALTASFLSLLFDDNAANTSGFLNIPPDPIGAAGPTHVVSVVNVSIQFHTKAGTPLLDTTAGAPVTGVSLASFFAPVAPVNNTFDPKVIYDQHAGRFVVVTLERVDTGAVETSRILVAVSDDSNPVGTWFFTAINSKINIGGTDTWADYPGFAVDEEAVYITNNMFGFASSGGANMGVRLWVIAKTVGAGGGFYGGGTATVGVFDPYAGAGLSATTQPAHIFGGAPATPNVGTWLTSYSGLSNGTTESVQVVRIDDPIGPGATTFTQQFIDIGNIEDLAGALPDAPQMGTPETIETNDRRALHAVWRGNALWMTATVDPLSGPGQATAHWWKLDTTTPAAVALVQQGDIPGDDLAAGTHTFFPSIAVNSSGDVAIGFAASASTIFPSSAYTTLTAAGAPTGSVFLRSGTDFYVRTFDSPPCSPSPARNRWGDYSGISVDPSDQCFWVFNEHAMTRGTGTAGDCNGRPATEDGRWATAFGKFCVAAGPCPTTRTLSLLTVSTAMTFAASVRIDVTTVTVTSAGNLKLESPQVTFGNGFVVSGQLEIENKSC